MQETVAINGITLCHKHSDGWVRSTLPDVCKSPAAPVPYTNVAFAKDLADGTMTVFSHGGAMNGVKGSRFAKSIGDEPGVGGGVISGVNLHEATWLSWSPDVFMEGRPVTRLTDKMLLNKGNTVSVGGYFTGPVTGASKATLDLLCNIACNCKAAGTARQRCVHLAVKGLPKTAGAGIYSEVTFDPSGQMMRHPDGAPMTRYATAGSRMDVVTVAGGAPVEFIEMKFGEDAMGPTQRARYQAIAQKHGKQLQEIWVDEQCKCDDGKKQPVTAPQTAPKTSEDEQGSWVSRHPYLTAVGAGAAVGLGYLGAAACAAAEPCGAIAASILGAGALTKAATQ
jgi:Domain of unknown function (DUF4150)